MISKKIKALSTLVKIRKELQHKSKKVIFTNGIFDILHRGHVEYLEKAKLMGDVLILGLNSDSSARKVKGEGRPILPQEDRARVLAGLESVDYVCYFDEETPARIIEALRPDILVKGGDYKIEDIVGRDVLRATGGKVVTIPLTPDRSTTDVIMTIAERIKAGNLKL